VVMKYTKSIYGGGNSKSTSELKSTTKMRGKRPFAEVAPPTMGGSGNPSKSELRFQRRI
jgi:hypothetical protein